MSLDTLLKAAQYIEQQEQKNENQLSITPSSLGEFFQRSQQQSQNQHLQHFYDNVNNSRNNNSRHHHQVSSSSSSSSSPTSSPPTAYVLSNGQMIHNSNSCNNNNNNNSSSQLNNNDFDYGVEAVTSAVAATAVNGRSSEGHSITEEPYSNGHSSPSSFIKIQTPLSSTTTSATTNKLIQQSQLQQGLQSQQQQQQQQLQQQHQTQLLSNSPKSETLSSLFSNNKNNTTITIVDNNKNAMFSNGNVGSVAAGAAVSPSNGGVNLAALSAAAAAVSSQPIVINVTNNRTATNTFNGNMIPHSTNSSSVIRNSPPIGIVSASTAATIHRKNCIPLTPPPMSTRKFVESSRIRSFSLSSNKITANGLIGSNGTTPALLRNHQIHQALAEAAAAAGSEDSSQSSLNLSASAGGYMNGTGSIGSLNFSGSNNGGGALNGVNMINGSPPRGGSLLVAGGHLDHPMSGVASSAPTSSGVHQLHGGMVGGTRRRTISSNSNGSSCTSRAGTREVHNKLEKHRRAQLKECFEQLKNQLPLKDEERKKTSNLAILGAALKQIKDLQRQEQELEQQSEQLAKEKINAQKKIVSLKRELGAKIDNIDFSSISTDIELGSIPIERVTEGLNDSISLSSGRGSMLYSSSSSLSSGSGGNTMSSPLGAGMQTAMPTALSPVISQSTSSSSSLTNSPNNSSPISPNMMILKSSSLITSSSPSTLSTAASASGPLTVTMPLSLTAKNISATSLTRGSPTPSTPSPSPSSSSGVSSSSSIHSSSPPIGGGVKVVPNIPANSVKFGAANVSANGNTFVSSPVINITSHSENNGGISSSNSGYYATGMPLNMNSAVAASIIPSCSTSSTSSPFFSSISIHSTSSASSSSSPSVPAITTISHSKELNCNGRNGLTRKVPSSDSHSNNNNDSSMFGSSNPHNLHHQHHHQQHKLLDEGEQPAKVFKVYNGIALGSVDKDNKLGLAGPPLQLSQVVGGGSLVVSPFLASSPNGGANLRLVGTNSLATIELSSGPQSSNVSSSSRCNSGLSSASSSPPNNGGAQLHKLLMSAVGASSGGVTNTASNLNGSYVPTAELGRLPGGAELNILPTASNGTTSLYRGNGKLAIVNSGISLKGAGNDTDSSNNSARGVHVMNGPVVQSSGLASIAVSQVQPSGNFAQLIAASPQLAGKVNLSVGGQNLPILSSQYLGSMKPMVVAVPNNSNQPTLPSSTSVVVSPTSTASTAIVTGTTNGNAL